VTTLKGPEQTLLSWIEYHLGIGFDHLFLFFDDVNDSAIEYARRYPVEKVSVILCDIELRERQKSQPFYSFISPFLENEVIARQELNADTALLLAKEMGIEWLLHIDIDELFYTTSNLTDHFKNLKDDNVGMLTYMNLEGVPEKSNIDDYFVDVTLFRNHLSNIKLTPNTSECLNFWKNKRNHGQYMLAYDIGKSVVRVIDGVVPDSVHRFRLPKDCELASCTAIADVRSLDITKIYNCVDTFILHYVSCGYKWWHKKYQILDLFPDHWYGGKLKIQPCFHLDSRDVYLEGDVEKMKKFYSSQVVLSNKEEIERQIESNMCIYITKPRDLILNIFPEKMNKIETIEETDEKKYQQSHK